MSRWRGSGGRCPLMAEVWHVSGTEPPAADQTAGGEPAGDRDCTYDDAARTPQDSPRQPGGARSGIPAAAGAQRPAQGGGNRWWNWAAAAPL